jgi:hypothetical protein
LNVVWKRKPLVYAGNAPAELPPFPIVTTSDLSLPDRQEGFFGRHDPIYISEGLIANPRNGDKIQETSLTGK